MRRRLYFSWEEWDALPQWQADEYWSGLVKEIEEQNRASRGDDDDDEDGEFDDWADDPNVVVHA